MHLISVFRIAVLLLLLAWLPASAQRLALTFDDGLDPGRDVRAAATNAQLLGALRTTGVRAMLFPSLVRIGGDAGLPLVRRWGEESHLVGNHTASHRSLSSRTITLEAFIDDVRRADTVLSGLPGFRPMLRFPFLKEGNDEAKRDGMREWLANHDYRPAPVSIDTSDWYYAQVDETVQAAGNEELSRKLLDAYVAHLLDRAAFYDGLARTVLGRSPAHVMLLHVNTLNARALPSMVKAFRAKGWTFIDPATAFDDPLYHTASSTLPAGESIVWSLARQAGHEGLRYPAEDAQYERDRLRAAGLPTP